MCGCEDEDEFYEQEAGHASGRLFLRHPILWLRVWWAPRVRGSRENPLEMRDLDNLYALLDLPPVTVIEVNGPPRTTQNGSSQSQEGSA